MILKCLADFSHGRSYANHWFAGRFRVVEVSASERDGLCLFVGATVSVKGNFKYMYRGGRYRATLEEDGLWNGQTQYAATEIAEAPSTKADMRDCIDRATYVGVDGADVDAVWAEFGRGWYRALSASTRSKSYGRLVTCLGGGVSAREKLCVFLEHFCPGGWSRRVAGAFPSLGPKGAKALASRLDSIERFGDGTDAAEGTFKAWCENPWLLVEHVGWTFVDKVALLDLAKDPCDERRLSGALVAVVMKQLGNRNTAVCMDSEFPVGKWYFGYVMPRIDGFAFSGPKPRFVRYDVVGEPVYDFSPVAPLVHTALRKALSDGLLCGLRTEEGFCVGLSRVRNLEDALAWRLGTNDVAGGGDEDAAMSLLTEYCEACDRELDFSQVEAVINSVTNTTSVVCGRPGYGKSSAIDAICWVWRRLVDAAHPERVETRILTLSGMAGQRVRDEDVRGPYASIEDPHPGYANSEVFTLAYTKRHREVLAEASLVIVDETSMCSNEELGHVAKSIPAGCLLVLVGDDHQLSPIGPGKAFADLVGADEHEACPFPVSTLAVNHRLESALGADALMNSLDAVRNRVLADFEACVADGAPHVSSVSGATASVTASVVDRFCERLDAVDEDYSRVRVLCPSHAGYLGRLAVCVAIRERVNPESNTRIDFERTCLASYRCEERGVALRATGQANDDRTLHAKGQAGICRAVGFEPKPWWAASRKAVPGSPETLCVGFRVGDRVVCNSGMGEVFNGDVGTIVAFTCDRGKVFYDGKVEIELDRGGVYSFCLEDVDTHFDLGYAITVHKSQGCEFDDVIVCLDSGHPSFMTNSMLYTALSRTKRRVDVFCVDGILERMIEQADEPRRSLLMPRVHHFVDNPGDVTWRGQDW